ncbi:MAG: PilT protein domain protein [Verrucomicrobiales bacterium]|nr:PilT protein domain protein [Verrucomicrobiales bacterium]
MAYLLDTNAWIVYLKSPASPIKSRLANLTPRDVRLCSIVKAELLHGAEKYGNRERRLSILNQLFAPYTSLPFDDAAAHAYSRTRHELEVLGIAIGPHDLMIAAIALAHNLIVVTHNTAEFSRVPGLQTVDWES